MVEKKKRIAVIRVRGKVHVRKEIADTLKKLKLTKPNHCVIVDSRDSYMGMIKKVKDYVTYGEISQKTMEKLIRERGLLEGNKKITEDYIKKNKKFKSIEEFVKAFMEFKAELKDINLKGVFRLEPPKKGYERKGIKLPFSKGGALGYRSDKINSLIERML
ncbi:MAG: 50S ribosomal protein L30 [Candidatus Altiarchaeota archaeon]